MTAVDDTWPRGCIVLGCGRSGTSAVAGLLAAAGFDLGSRLLPPNESNPLGFFEDRRVNELNEILLAPVVDERGDFDGRYARPLRQGERWLAALPPDVEVPCRPELDDEMRSLTPGHAAWCRKDPRFSYTLECWPSPVAEATRICVFRHPAATARSMVEHAANGTLGLSFEVALELWSSVHRRILGWADRGGTWVFVEYEAILSGDGVTRLSRALGVHLDAARIRPSLRRSRDGEPIPAGATAIHRELLGRSRLTGTARPAGHSTAPDTSSPSPRR